MKYVGMALLVLAAGLWIPALGFQDSLGVEQSAIFMISSLSFGLLGFTALAISAAISIRNGEARLRPWDALKSATMIFLVLLAVKFLISEFFFTGIRNWTGTILWTVIIAIVLGLYSTAEEKLA